MTEYSYFYNGAVHGDAHLAPYHDDLYAKLRALLYGNSYVLDNYPTSTFGNITAAGGMALATSAGTMFVDGSISSGGGAIVISANTSGNPRIDLVVIRIDWVAQTIYQIVKSGFPAAFPAVPELIQKPGEIYEMPLALIFVANGAAAIGDEDIIDQRNILESANNVQEYGSENLVLNSEFMAGAGTSWDGAAATTGAAPAYWNKTSDAVCEWYKKYDHMERGSTVYVTLHDTTEYLNYTRQICHTTAVPVTIHFFIEVIKGEVEITTPFSTKNIPANSSLIEVYIRETYDDPDNELDITFGNALATETIFRLGQVTACYGTGGVPFQSEREMIIFSKAVEQTSYEWPTTLAAGDRLASIPEEVGQGVHAVLSKLFYRDSASAGSSDIVAYLRQTFTTSSDFAQYLTTQVGRDVNDAIRVEQGWISAPRNTGYVTAIPPTSVPTSQQVRIINTATGAFSADIGINYLGCTT